MPSGIDLYRVLVRLVFPRPFHTRFADEMCRHFSQRRQAVRAHGWNRRTAFWFRALTDIVVHGLAERRAVRLRHGGTHVMWSSISGDIRYAIRTLRAKPGFTIAALLTLALGIGANTAIFSVVHAVLIRDLPYPEPERLVRVYETHRRYGFNRGVVNPFNLDTWQRDAKSFTHLAPTRMTSMTLTGMGDAARVSVPQVDAQFFDVIGLQPALGRVFSSAEAEAGSRLLVLPYDSWRSRFGGDESIVDRPVTLNDQPWSIVGVLPAGVKIPEGADFIRPLHLDAKTRAAMGSWYLGVVGRLRPGVAIEEAQRELDSISARLEQQFPAQRKDRGAHIVSLHEDLTDRVVDGLALLQAVVIVVLLVACANLANLQLAQTSARLCEFAVRSAVGAYRVRLVRQLLTESVVLSVVGGALGVIVALLGVSALIAAAPATLVPAFAEIGVSVPALLFTLGLAIVSGILFGVAPALLFSRPDLVTTLRDESQGSTGSGRRSLRLLRSGLIAAEVALAVVLFVGATLLVRSFSAVTSQDPGFDTSRLLTASLTLASRYDTPESKVGFTTTLSDRLTASGAVRGVAISTALPFSNWEWQTDFQLGSAPDLDHDGTSIRSISVGYFRELGVRLTEGREFTSDDRLGSEPVAIVNDTFARQFLAGRSPIGERIRTNRRVNEWMTIVGVAASTRHTELHVDPNPELYRPFAQHPQALITIAVRTSGDVEVAEPLLRAAVRDLDPTTPLQQMRPMDALIGQTVSVRRFHMALLAAFAGLAGVLTIVGVYGVTSYVAGLRTREIGIRVALGASARSVARLVVGQGTRPVLLGLTAGLGVAFYASKVLESELFGVTARDATTFTLTAVTFLIVGVLACLLPARRCATVDPSSVLRDS